MTHAPQGAIDCDIHPALPSVKLLLPHLDEYWREHILRRGLERDSFETLTSPTLAPLNARPDWTPAADQVETLRAHVLDRAKPEFAICNVIHGAQMMMSEDLSAALCRAINNWLAKEWLDRDPRLRASIVVPIHSPDLAAEEIDRMAEDKRFVQVLLLSMAELPLGRRQNWPIYRAAERHGLPIGIHAGSSFRHPLSAVGWGSTYLEDYISYSQGMAGALDSLVVEGVFHRFPNLKAVLIESGVAWHPAAMWRLDKTWRGVRAETPWLTRMPSSIVRDHVRMTAQPFDAPPDQKSLDRLLDQLGGDDILLYASDYPHWHHDDHDALPDGLPADLVRKICFDNPLATYPRLAVPATA